MLSEASRSQKDRYRATPRTGGPGRSRGHSDRGGGGGAPRWGRGASVREDGTSCRRGGDGCRTPRMCSVPPSHGGQHGGLVLLTSSQPEAEPGTASAGCAPLDLFPAFSPKASRATHEAARNFFQVRKLGKGKTAENRKGRGSGEKRPLAAQARAGRGSQADGRGEGRAEHPSAT